MSSYSFPLNPLLESVTNQIRKQAKGLKGFNPLELSPDLENIYGELEGNKLLIINEFHQAQGFRKIHIETGVFGSSLEILHAVFFPFSTYDLPIFGVDLVSVPTGVSAAIVDLSPVRKKLPTPITNELSKLQYPSFSKVRNLPDWGDIFSDFVQFISPKDSTENELFLNLVSEFLNILINYSASIEPDPIDSSITKERYEGQLYYCKQQKRNDKTRDVLARTFGNHWANEYIEKVLFDTPLQN